MFPYQHHRIEASAFLTCAEHNITDKTKKRPYFTTLGSDGSVPKDTIGIIVHKK